MEGLVAARENQTDAGVGERVGTHGMVTGLSTRAASHVVTRFFDGDEIPTEARRLVGLLKGRLEATNAPP